MKVELSHLERGYLANLYRARAAKQRRLAADRSKAAIRAELDAEADWCEEQAQRLDDAEESSVAERPPARVTERRDLDSVDEKIPTT